MARGCGLAEYKREACFQCNLDPHRDILRRFRAQRFRQNRANIIGNVPRSRDLFASRIPRHAVKLETLFEALSHRRSNLPCFYIPSLQSTDNI